MSLFVRGPIQPIGEAAPPPPIKGRPSRHSAVTQPLSRHTRTERSGGERSPATPGSSHPPAQRPRPAAAPSAPPRRSALREALGLPRLPSPPGSPTPPPHHPQAADRCRMVPNTFAPFALALLLALLSPVSAAARGAAAPAPSGRSRRRL